MPLSSEQLEDLKQAATTLLIIGRFRLPSEGEIIEPIVFEGPKLSSQCFYDEIKPSLGRKYTDRYVGKHLKKSIVLQVPKEAGADSMQRILPDSPLLQGEVGGMLAVQGKEVFSKVILLLDTITRFQHPEFSSDLIEVAWNFIVECHDKNFAETDLLAKFCRTLEVKRLIQLYLLCPSGDEATILPLFTPLLDSSRLGQETVDIFVESLDQLKEILSGTDDISETWKNTTKPGSNCDRMADGNGYNSVPGIESSATTDFRSAYRHVKLATDELHAICGSPELWSYMFWWLGSLAGNLPETGATEAKTPGVMNLYKLCVQEQGQRVPAVGARLLEDRESAASAKLSSFGQTLKESVHEIHRLQAQEILNEMRKIFNPNHPTTREEIENKTAMLYKGMAFLVDKGFREKYEAYQASFSSDVRISRDILNARKEDGSGFESRSEFEEYLKVKVSNESKDQVIKFLQSTAFTEVTEGPDMQLRVDTAFYGFLAESVLQDFEAWAKTNEPNSIEMSERVERLFRCFHLGQLGSGHSEMPGLPITVTLKANTAQELMLNVKGELDSRKAEASPVQANIEATAAINTAIGEVESGEIVVGNESGGTWKKKGNTIALKLDRPIPVESLSNAELRDESGKKLASPRSSQQADTEPAVSHPKPPANEVKQVALDLASLDHEVSAAIKDSSIVITEASDELTDLSDDDLIYWEKLLKDVHGVYVEGGSEPGTRLILRSYRASSLGRFLLAAPDSRAPFGREDVSNIMGLLVDMAQHLGDLHGDKTLGISNSQAELNAALRKINLSQYYPVSDEAELSRVFNYHYSLIKSIEDVRAYLSEVTAIANLFDAAHGSGLRIVVANKTLGEEVSPDFASNNVLTNHPARTAYLTSQNEPTDLDNAWANLQKGLSTSTSVQVPVFVAHKSLHSGIDGTKLPALVKSESVIIPSAEHCLGMPADCEWLAVACACTSADADRLGIYIKKTDTGHDVRGLGVLRPIKKNIGDKDGLGDVVRNELSNKGLIGKYNERKSVVAAIREGLMKSMNSNNYFQQLVCARLLTFALLERKGGTIFPVKLIQALGGSPHSTDILSSLLAGLTEKKITLTSKGNLLDGTHKSIDESSLRLSIGKQGEEQEIFDLIIPIWMIGFADKGSTPETKVVD